MNYLHCRLGVDLAPLLLEKYLVPVTFEVMGSRQEGFGLGSAVTVTGRQFVSVAEVWESGSVAIAVDA